MARSLCCEGRGCVCAPSCGVSSLSRKAEAPTNRGGTQPPANACAHSVTGQESRSRLHKGFTRGWSSAHRELSSVRERSSARVSSSLVRRSSSSPELMEVETTTQQAESQWQVVRSNIPPLLSDRTCVTHRLRTDRPAAQEGRPRRLCTRRHPRAAMARGGRAPERPRRTAALGRSYRDDGGDGEEEEDDDFVDAVRAPPRRAAGRLFFRHPSLILAALARPRTHHARAARPRRPLRLAHARPRQPTGARRPPAPRVAFPPRFAHALADHSSRRPPRAPPPRAPRPTRTS